MANEFDSYVGVEANRDRLYPFTYAAIDKERVIRAFGRGSLKDAFAFLAGQESALAAINSPMTTNNGLMKREEIRKTLSAKSNLGRWANLRLVEFELLERGVHVPRTPGTLKNSPRWMKLGFRLFEEIGKLGYQPYPDPAARKQYFECQGEAAFWNLLGHAPLKENTLEGRIQRQLVLQMCGLPVPDAMQFFEEITRHKLLASELPLDSVYSNEELNAVAAAYTAWLAANQSNQIVKVGHEDEGLIYLPDAAMQDLTAH
ncbi:MAG: DUF429 domain-containing protein [Chloroflexi bacterium]|nr:DUF429 domain-containing protein [Chloroflexota bacterium]